MKFRGWRIFILSFLITCLVIHTDRKRAEAIVPVAFVAAAPYVLAALVGGTTALWCYTHGGKEAWIKMHGAMLDGAQVTKQWIQEQIAQINGISTDSETQSHPLSVGQYVNHVNGLSYKITGYQGLHSDWKPNFGGNSSYFYVGSLRVFAYDINSFGDCMAYVYNIDISDSKPVVSFDPANYPELYTGPALLSNCHQVAKQNPGLVLQYTDWQPTEPDTPADPVYVPPVHIVATLPDGRTVDNTGKIHPPLPGQPWIWPGATTPPSAVPGAVGELPVLQPDGSTAPVAVPQSLIDKLRAAGLPENAVITGATPSTITWQDTNTNATQYMPIPADVAAEMPKAITQAQGPSAGEVETGDVIVPPLPEVGEFASDFEYDQPEDWNWSAWMNNPFQSVIDSMKIETSSATSVIHFPVNLGFHQFTVSADFAQFAGTFQTLGGFMVIMSGFMAIMLVIKK